MKKIFIFLITTIFCFTALYSCKNTGEENDALKKADEYGKAAGNSQYNYQKDLTDWLLPEEKYDYTSEDNTNNIDSRVSSHFIKGDKFYFTVSNDHNNDSWAYVSLKTGEKLYLCPDPLCPHTKESGCKYLNLGGLIFSPDSNNIIYSVKKVFSDSGIYDVICVIDTENDTYRELYTSETISTKTFNMYTLYFIRDNKLYFLNEQRENKITDSGELEKETTYYFMALDLETNKAKIVDNKYASQEYGSFVYANDEYIFFEDFTNGRIFATDLNFENEQTVLEYGKDFTRRSLYYDKDTKEIFLAICSKYMVGLSSSDKSADNIEAGYVYCIDNNLNYRKLDMPTDKIIEIQLTKNYIYYTTYDPVYYGISPRGLACTDETGNKIYRVSRNNTSSGELIFNGHGILFFSLGYTITGDYIYIDYTAFVSEGGMTWFRRMGSTARVNFVNGTIKWLNLD